MVWKSPLWEIFDRCQWLWLVSGQQKQVRCFISVKLNADHINLVWSWVGLFCLNHIWLIFVIIWNMNILCPNHGYEKSQIAHKKLCSASCSCFAEHSHKTWITNLSVYIHLHLKTHQSLEYISMDEGKQYIPPYLRR